MIVPKNVLPRCPHDDAVCERNCVGDNEYCWRRGNKIRKERPLELVTLICERCWKRANCMLLSNGDLVGYYCGLCANRAMNRWQAEVTP